MARAWPVALLLALTAAPAGGVVHGVHRHLQYRTTGGAAAPHELGAAGLQSRPSRLWPLDSLDVAECQEADKPGPPRRSWIVSNVTDATDGVVCKTLLNPSIRDEQFNFFLDDAGISRDNFDVEVNRLCAGSDASDYTGSWNDHAPTENDPRIMEELSHWTKQQKADGLAQNWTWRDYAMPDNGTYMRDIIQQVLSEPTKINATGPMRVLDLGCGGGRDILAIKEAFNLRAEDTLCLDVRKVKGNLTSIVLNSSSPKLYKKSLQGVLKTARNSVHIAISVVTFHHIVPPMRKHALRFLTRVLAPGGVFFMADWDNAVTPSRWIYYDLMHRLPWIFLANPKRVSMDPMRLKQGSEYLSVDGWVKEVERYGLDYWRKRSRIEKNGTERLAPQELANTRGVHNRKFYLVFGKSMRR